MDKKLDQIFIHTYTHTESWLLNIKHIEEMFDFIPS